MALIMDVDEGSPCSLSRRQGCRQWKIVSTDNNSHRKMHSSLVQYLSVQSRELERGMWEAKGGFTNRGCRCTKCDRAAPAHATTESRFSARRLPVTNLYILL